MTHDPPPFRRSGLDAVVGAIGRGPLWPPLAYALLAGALVGLCDAAEIERLRYHLTTQPRAASARQALGRALG